MSMMIDDQIRLLLVVENMYQKDVLSSLGKTVRHHLGLLIRGYQSI